VNQHERRNQPSKVSIRELQIMTDKGTKRDDDLTINIVDEINRRED
jgi:hypothetical protein